MQKVETLSVAWLTEQTAVIELPSVLAQRTAVCRILFDSLPPQKHSSKKKKLMSVLSGITERTLHRYCQSGFSPTPLNQVKRIRRNLQACKVSVDQATSFTVKIVFKGEGALISEAVCDFENIFPKAKRNVDNGSYEGLATFEEIEPVVLRICKTFACGGKSIEDCCEGEGVSYQTFIQWALEHSNLSELYRTAIKLAIYWSSIQAQSLINDTIVAMLKKGKHETQVTFYERKNANDNEIQWIEKSKKITEADLSLSELCQLKKLVQEDMETHKPKEEDEFSKMSLEDLQAYINQFS